MKLDFNTLDVFSSSRYAGNPVAIISVPASAKESLTQTQKQRIASEFNLSEIVFLHLPTSSASQERHIDIFTSHAEVPFAGHPTIGTSHYLLHTTKQDITALITKAGRIGIELDPETQNVKAEIPHDFHRHVVTWTTPLNDLANPTCSIVNGMSFIMVQLPTLAALALAKSNLAGYTYDTTPLDAGWQNGLIATMYFVSQGTDALGRRKYRTRMFGTREDPGTGSASSALGCLLTAGGGKERFVFEQGVEMGRRNVIEVEVVRGEEGVERVVLGGAVVEVMKGNLEV